MRAHRSDGPPATAGGPSPVDAEALPPVDVEQLVHAAFDHSPAPQALLDRHGSVVRANAALRGVLGLPPEVPPVLAHPLAGPGGRMGADCVARALRDHARRGVDAYELTYDHPDGRQLHLGVTSAPLPGGHGNPSGFVALVTDLSEQRRLQEQLEVSARRDHLTGLPNRLLVDDRLAQAALAGRDARWSVLWLDVDELGLVNDSRGHDVGDRVLVELARRLERAAGPAATVARSGGDEFVVLLPDCDLPEAERVAAHLLEVVRAPVVVGGHALHVTASCGVASAGPEDADTLLRHADTALSAAKAGGRARVQRFDPSLAAAAEATFALATDLRLALAHDELELHYQPIVSLPTGRTVGYEALARWDHPARGPIPPDSFVDLAERVGLSRELDCWALRRAAADLAGMSSWTGSDEPYVSVNISATNLGSAEIEHLVMRATNDAGIAPHRLALEITERSLMRDVERSSAVLRRLRARGHPIVVDDFGTGYSSLSYLRDFPISTIKIDRAFVGPAVSDPNAAAIVSSIVQMAAATGATTVAEGVETAEHARLLAQLGCSAGQGWWWAPATPVTELRRLRRQFLPAPRRGVDRYRGSTRLEDLGAEHGLERIRDMHAAGASPATIAAALNAEDFRTPHGHRWHWMSVARVLLHVGPATAPTA